MFRLVARRLCVARADLLLEQFARRSGKAQLSAQLAEYMQAKKEFDDLIEKYEIFSAKEKSVEDAAKLVGLHVPKSTHSH